MASFAEEMRMSMVSLIEKGLTEARLDNEGDPLSIKQINKLWFNVRLRDRIGFTLTAHGKDIAELEAMIQVEKVEQDEWAETFVNGLDL